MSGNATKLRLFFDIRKQKLHFFAPIPSFLLLSLIKQVLELRARGLVFPHEGEVTLFCNLDAFCFLLLFQRNDDLEFSHVVGLCRISLDAHFRSRNRMQSIVAIIPVIDSARENGKRAVAMQLYRDVLADAYTYMKYFGFVGLESFRMEAQRHLFQSIISRQ